MANRNGKKNIQGWLDSANEVEGEILTFHRKWKQEQQSIHGFSVTDKDYIVHASQALMEKYTGEMPPVYKSTEPVLNHKTMQIIEELRNVYTGFAQVLDQLRNLDFSPAQGQAVESIKHSIDAMGYSLAQAFDDSDFDEDEDYE